MRCDSFLRRAEEVTIIEKHGFLLRRIVIRRIKEVSGCIWSYVVADIISFFAVYHQYRSFYCCVII